MPTTFRLIHVFLHQTSITTASDRPPREEGLIIKLFRVRLSQSLKIVFNGPRPLHEMGDSFVLLSFRAQVPCVRIHLRSKKLTVLNSLSQFT